MNMSSTGGPLFASLKQTSPATIKSSLPSIDDDNDSSEPSLANSSVSSASRTDVSRQGPLHTSLPLHPQSSLLDMTRDDSHDINTSAELSMDLGLGLSAAYHSPDTSLLDEDDDEDDDILLESESFTIMERGIANISESLSGSFCTQGNEVNNSCTMMNCSTYVSDKVKQKKLLFSDKILQNRLMDDLHYILGSSTSPCCNEKSIFTNCMGKDFPSTAAETILNLDREGDIRNRAGESWRARAYRIKRLREERMIQDAGLAHAMTGLQMGENSIGRSASFSHNRQAQAVAMPMRPKQEVNVEALGCMIGDCIEPISKWDGDQDDMDLKTHEEYKDEQDLCYDSDPGIISRSRQRKVTTVSPDIVVASPVKKTDKHIKSPRKNWFRSPRRRRRQMHFDSFDDSLDASKATQDKTEVDVAMDLVRNDFYGFNDHESFDDIDTPRMARPKSKKANVKKIDCDIQANVQNALNQSWTLTWHPPSGDGSSKKKKKVPSGSRYSTPTVSPRCIKLWFERGNRIRHNDVLEPKLMWRDAYHPDLTSQRKLNISTIKGPQQICLLNICRIMEANKLNRKKYPFAKKCCSFIIRTSEDEEFVFETASKQERDEIVYTWKLVVARLASQAVVGDGEGMVGEFFVSSSFGVP